MDMSKKNIYSRLHYEKYRDVYSQKARAYYYIHRTYKLLYEQQRIKQLRKQVLDLYAPDRECDYCGAPVEELHHADPEQGRIEHAALGTSTKRDLMFQIAYHKNHPGYLIPVCVSCHKKIHVALKKIQKMEAPK